MSEALEVVGWSSWCLYPWGIRTNDLETLCFPEQRLQSRWTAEEWRMRLNLPVYDYSYEEAQTLIKEIFTKKLQGLWWMILNSWGLSKRLWLSCLWLCLVTLFRSSVKSTTLRSYKQVETLCVLGTSREHLLNEAYVKLGIHALSSTTYVKDQALAKAVISRTK